MLKDAFPFEKKPKTKGLFARIDDSKGLNEQLYNALRVYAIKKQKNFIISHITYLITCN